MCYASKQKISLIDLWLPFWISSVLPSCNHFVCTSFFVDIYIIMIVFYLESWSHERSYISNWYPLFFHVHRYISFFQFLVASWKDLFWVRILFSYILMHSLAVKIIFPHACLDEGFAISIGIPPLDKVIISYLHHGLSQALVLNLFF